MSDSFESIMTRLMNRAPDTRDKRQGSILYDMFGPVSAELAEAYIHLAIYRDQTYLLTAVGENLDNRGADYGMSRNPATQAIRIVQSIDVNGNPFEVPVGSRFATPNVSGAVNYTVIQNIGLGVSYVRCDVSGTVGNAYLGPLLPLYVINNLRSAEMVGTYIPAEDTETDEAFRQRIIDRLNQKAYGGNIADYKEFTTAISGVGAVKVFPIWDGGGTVMLSIVDSEYNRATAEFIEYVQNEIDPIEHSGTGVGIAPIGHRVTVVTPDEYTVNIHADVALQEGYNVPLLQASIEEAIGEYMRELRQLWADSTTSNVFISRITAAILNVHGVDNVTGVTINNSTDDLELAQTPQQQWLPTLGGVDLNVS